MSVTHIEALLLVLRLEQPELILVLHDVGQHGASHEHHVLPAGRVLDADLELLQKEKVKRC